MHVIVVDSILVLKPKTCLEYCGLQIAECCASGSHAYRLSLGYCVFVMSLHDCVIVTSLFRTDLKFHLSLFSVTERSATV